MNIEENNSQILFEFAKNLELTGLQSAFQKILEILNNEGYALIKATRNSKGNKFKTFWHYRESRCDSPKNFIIINPDIEDHLNGERINFLWSILHEVGHILTIGIRNDDQEMREVIAWDMAYHLIRCDITELESKLESFESRAIYSLKNYWSDDRYNWDNTYEWATNKWGDRVLKRKPLQKTIM